MRMIVHETFTAESTKSNVVNDIQSWFQTGWRLLACLVLSHTTLQSADWSLLDTAVARSSQLERVQFHVIEEQTSVPTDKPPVQSRFHKRWSRFSDGFRVEDDPGWEKFQDAHPKWNDSENLKDRIVHSSDADQRIYICNPDYEAYLSPDGDRPTLDFINEGDDWRANYAWITDQVVPPLAFWMDQGWHQSLQIDPQDPDRVAASFKLPIDPRVGFSDGTSEDSGFYECDYTFSIQTGNPLAHRLVAKDELGAVVATTKITYEYEASDPSASLPDTLVEEFQTEDRADQITKHLMLAEVSPAIADDGNRLTSFGYPEPISDASISPSLFSRTSFWIAAAGIMLVAAPFLRSRRRPS